MNFVSPTADGAWRMRTFERGVEGETLACGTGAVASTAVLRDWGLVGPTLTVVTRSGLPVTVSFDPEDPSAAPALAGEGRIVFEGRFGSL